MNAIQGATTGFALPGFQDPTFDATHVFRATLTAMSRPGEIQDLECLCAAPESLNSACAAIILALADMETHIWLSPEMDNPQARDFIRFHTGCPITDTPKNATFAVINTQTNMATIKDLPVGTQEYPDRSATVIVAVDRMEATQGVTLTGPGIETSNNISLANISDAFWSWRERQSKIFPLGIDVIFASQNQISALPRTTSVEL